MNVVKRQKRDKALKRIRASFGKNTVFEALVFKSCKCVYAQIINLNNGNVVASSSSLSLKEKLVAEKVSRRSLKAGEFVGIDLADKFNKLKIDSVPSFNRASYRFHGIVKALADVFFENVCKK